MSELLGGDLQRRLYNTKKKENLKKKQKINPACLFVLSCYVAVDQFQEYCEKSYPYTISKTVQTMSSINMDIAICPLFSHKSSHNPTRKKNSSWRVKMAAFIGRVREMFPLGYSNYFDSMRNKEEKRW